MDFVTRFEKSMRAATIALVTMIVLAVVLHAALTIHSAFGADFVVKRKLDYPAPKTPVNPTPNPRVDPEPQLICQCGCGKTGCQCRHASQCSPSTVLAVQDIDYAAVFGAIEEQPVELPRVQWLVISTNPCEPCDRAKKDFADWMRRGGWSVGISPADWVRLVDGDCETEICEKYNAKEFPFFVLLVDGEPVIKKSPYPGRQYLVDEWNKAYLSLPPKMETEGLFGPIVVTTIPQAVVDAVFTIAPRLKKQFRLPFGEIRANLGGYDVHVPDDVLVTMTVGETIRFALMPKPSVKVTKFGLAYSQELDAVVFDRSGATLSLPRMVDLRLPAK